MEIATYQDHELFAKECINFLSNTQALELENNLALGLLERLKHGEYKSPFLSLIKSTQGEIKMAPMMTAPFNMVLSRGDLNAIPFFCNYLKEHHIAFPGIIGLENICTRFAEQWNVLDNKQLVPSLELYFYAVTAEDIQNPITVRGQMRRAQSQDLSLLMDWMVNFAVDAGLSKHEQKQSSKKIADRILEGLYFIWEDDHSPVSVASYVPITNNGVRIGSVYTPEAKRGNGYATSCVASLSQQLLKQGKTWISLFADSDNPVSNGIYKKIGYSKRCTYQEFRFLK